jgi:hypothetical protein
MKVDSKIFKGIEFVEFNELPGLQQEKLLQTIGPQLFIKILIDGKIIDRCLQYKDYLMWYDTIYKIKLAPSKESKVTHPIEIEPKLALNKI